LWPHQAERLFKHLVFRGIMLPLGPWKMSNTDVDHLTGKPRMASVKTLVHTFGLPTIADDERSREASSSGEGREASSSGEGSTSGKLQSNVQHEEVHTFGLPTTVDDDRSREAFSSGEGSTSGVQHEEVDETDRTTLVIKNIPRHFNLLRLCRELSDLGFADAIDFVNVLEDKKGGRNRGYAFVNFVSNETARQCMETVKGHEWREICHDTMEVPKADATWAMVQGFAANYNMHPSQPADERARSQKRGKTRPDRGRRRRRCGRGNGGVQAAAVDANGNHADACAMALGVLVLL